MSDIFREVDEDLRRERYSKLWKKHGWLIIAIAVVIIAITAGYRGYQYYQTVQSAQTGARFQGAQNLLGEGQREEAVAILQEIAEGGGSAYDDLARFQLAGIAPDLEPAQRAELFISLAEDGSLEQAARDLARVRAGYILLDIAPRDEVAAAVEPLNVPENAFHYSAREILALAAYKAGDREAALDVFTEIVSDPGTPGTVRSRAEAYLDVIAGHEGNVLELPDEPTPAPQAQPQPSQLAPLGSFTAPSEEPAPAAPDTAPTEPAPGAVEQGATSEDADAEDEPATAAPAEGASQ